MHSNYHSFISYFCKYALYVNDTDITDNTLYKDKCNY